MSHKIEVNTASLRILACTCHSAKSILINYNKMEKREISLSTVYRYLRLFKMDNKINYRIDLRRGSGVDRFSITGLMKLGLRYSKCKRAPSSSMKKLKEDLKEFHECYICGTTFKNIHILQLHHAIRVADGGENSVDNLVALCPNCHGRVHSNEIALVRKVGGKRRWVVKYL